MALYTATERAANCATHGALMKLYHERYSQQVEATATERVLRDWV